MRIFLDIDTREFLQSPAFPRAITTLSLKRRDTDLIELQFLRDRVVQELPAGTAIRLGVKPAASYTADFLATGTFTKSGTGTSTSYLLDLNLNTIPLNTVFEAATPEPESLAAMLEIEWASGTNISSSLTLPIVIANDVIRGDEGAPANLPLFYTSETSDFLATQAEAESGADNTKWMSPLRTAQAITALASTGSHTHPLSDITQSSATTGQVPTWNGTNWVPQTPSGGGGGGGVSSWNDLTDKPSTFPPSTHTHAISDTTGLQAALDGKQASGSYAAATHTHDAASINSGTIAVARIPTGTTSSTVALGNHTHTFGTTAGTFAQGNHAHGNLTSAGAIGTTASLPVITGASGVLQAGSFGTTAGTFCQGDDSRLLNISGGITAIAVVTALPATPSATTLYIVTA